jgi:TolB-like protein/Tfp pilus assembly protein PilF
VLYEIATGQRPFVETRGVRLIEAILHQAPRPPTTLNSRVSPQLESIILKALDKDPKRRYQTAKELLADLERLEGLPLVPEGFALRPARPWFTLSVLVLTATTLVAALIAFNISGLRDRLRWNPKPARIRSLAVLPLENLSGDREQEYFVDGMTDELITDLARISSLRVISRTSVMQYKGTNKPLSEIARELNVDAVVEGTVMRSGDRVRITAKLVQAPTDKHLWAETYERDLRDVLALQGDVARDITSKVQVKLTSQEHARLSGNQPVNPEAYEAYLKGRYYMVKWTAESTKLAVEYFDQAIEKDPQYALAYAGLAECYATVWAPELGSEHVSKAETAATKALEIDDSVGEAHAALAVIRYLHAWDWSGAEAEFRKALALSPNDPDAHHWYSHFLLTMGRIEESRIESQRYLQLDPLSPAAHLHMGLHYLFARQYDKAIEWEQKTLQMEPNYVEAYRWLSRAYEAKGMYPQALVEIQKAVDLSKETGESERYIPSLAYIYARSGQIGSAQELLKTLNRTSEHTVRYPIDVAEVYVGLGDRQIAFEWLEKAYAQHDDSLPAILKVSPRFDPLRSDPRFQDLMHRVGLL